MMKKFKHLPGTLVEVWDNLKLYYKTTKECNIPITSVQTKKLSASDVSIAAKQQVIQENKKIL